MAMSKPSRAHLFRDFVDATAVVTIGESEVVIRYQKRAHNPLLVAAGFDRPRRSSRGWEASACGSSSGRLIPLLVEAWCKVEN